MTPWVHFQFFWERTAFWKYTLSQWKWLNVKFKITSCPSCETLRWTVPLTREGKPPADRGWGREEGSRRWLTGSAGGCLKARGWSRSCRCKKTSSGFCRSSRWNLTNHLKLNLRFNISSCRTKGYFKIVQGLSIKLTN